MGKKKRSRTPFWIGQPFDRLGNGVLDVMDKTGRTHAKEAEILNPSEVKNPLTDFKHMKVKWVLSCGTELVFKKLRGPDGEGVRVFRVIEIKLQDGTVIKGGAYGEGNEGAVGGDQGHS